MKHSLILSLLTIWIMIFVIALATPHVSAQTEDPDILNAASPKNIHDSVLVETKVTSIFKDAPIMLKIASCESKFRQFTDTGNVFRGGYNNNMVGVFQIHDSIHRSAALALGFDIDTLDGNLDYARHLYDQQGTDPWISSFACWNDNHFENTAASSDLTTTLTFGLVHPEVLILQQHLNKIGFTLTDTGPGSPGQETAKFGFLTRAAVRSFQCAENIVCHGDEYTTSYGVVGPRTRAALSRRLLVPISTPAPPAAPTTPTAAPEQPNSLPDSTNQDPEITALVAKIKELQEIISDLQNQLSLR